MKPLHIFFILTLIGIVGCSNQEDSAINDSSEIVLLNSNSTSAFEKDSVPKIAQSYLDNQSNDIGSYKAIHVDDHFFVAFNATPLKQAVEQKIEKDIKKDLESLTKIKNIHVTSDQKFFMELTKIENEQLTKQELIKRIEKLKKLSKEQT